MGRGKAQVMWAGTGAGRWSQVHAGKVRGIPQNPKAQMHRRQCSRTAGRLLVPGGRNGHEANVAGSMRRKVAGNRANKKFNLQAGGGAGQVR